MTRLRIVVVKAKNKRILSDLSTCPIIKTKRQLGNAIDCAIGHLIDLPLAQFTTKNEHTIFEGEWTCELSRVVIAHIGNGRLTQLKKWINQIGGCVEYEHFGQLDRSCPWCRCGRLMNGSCAPAGSWARVSCTGNNCRGCFSLAFVLLTRTTFKVTTT